MQGEDTWMSNQSADESAAKERYEYFTRPEPRENMSDIFEIDDPYLGPKTKVREVRIGMTRNAADENRKVVTAYLEPFPHIRIADAKQLQGWYQSKTNESKQSRPRPCFTEAVLTEPYGGYCLPAGSLVETPTGPMTIESLVPGGKVIGQVGKTVCEAIVTATVNRWCSSGLLELVTTDGESIQLTAEHPVFSLSRQDYIPAGEVTIGEEIESRSLQDVRASIAYGQTLQHAEVLSEASVLSRPYEGTSVPQARSRCCGVDLSDTELLGTDSREGRVSLQNPWRGGATQSWSDAKRGISPVSQRGTEKPRGPGEALRRSERETSFSSNQGSLRRAGTFGDYRSEEVSQEQICLSQRESSSSEIVLGTSYGRVPRFNRGGLVLRTGSHTSQEWGRLPAGFQSERRVIHRSERIHGHEGPVQNPTSQAVGALNQSIRRKDVGWSRASTVLEVRRLNTPIRVYDIETTTSNFYVRGAAGRRCFHVHNCAVGCQFCYINSGMRGYRGTGLISVPINYGEQIKEQLTKMRRGAAVYFSSFTDPFTPLENYYHNTQTAAQACVDVGLPLFFLSRLRYPEWAIDLLTKNPHSYAQKSINTCDPEDWRRLSPGAMPLAEHLKEITKLKKRGIYVSIQCNPIVAGITSNEQVCMLFRMLRDAGADHVIVKFVEAAYSWAPAMVERLKRVFGKDRGEKFERLFTQNIGSERTIEEGYRLRAHQLFSRQAKKLGLTYATCYEYRYEKDANGKILSKTGISIGRELTTAAQCHGHAVPVYTRNSADEKFRPVEECPPSGCLYCADENDGEARCGDELAGQANAVRWADLKVPIGQGKKRSLGLPLV